MTERILHIDVESRSPVDLPAANAFIYFDHPDTDLWCAAFSFGEDPDTWQPGDLCPDEVRDHIESGGLVGAWNCAFERLAFEKILGPRYGWPVPKLTQYRCTMVKALAMALPGKLELAAPALGLEITKDAQGGRLMLQMSKPRRPRKGEDPRKLLWWDSPDRIDRLIRYCQQDVRTEMAVDSRVLPLAPAEQALWFLDQQINSRGVYIDADLCNAAKKVVASAETRLDKELAKVTDRAVSGVSNNGQLTTWLRSKGLDIPGVAKDVIEGLLVREDLEPQVRRAVEIRQEGGKTSVAKIDAMLARRQKDGRMRGNLQFHGAATGRWCLTGDHEVLTPTGWARLDEWGGGRIATWSSSEQIAFTEAKALMFPFEGDMLHHVGKRVDQLATPDHRMPCWSPRTGEFETRNAATLGRGAVPFHGVRVNSQIVEADLLRVLVMVQADGHYTSDGDVRLRFKKQRKIERAKTLLRRAGVVFSVASHSDGTTQFSIRRRHVPLFLAMFKGKTFGWWLLDCDPQVFFDEIELWDGYRCGPQSVQYCTTNRQNAEIVQTFAHLSGRAACIVEKKDRRPEWAAAYYVNVWLQPGRGSETRERPGTVPYSGEVYCAETTTGFFLVRRNGKIWVTGNSGRGAQLQNLPRPSNEDDKQPMIDAILESKDDRLIEALYGNTLTVVADCIRGMITASPGHELFVADFSAIEARVNAWLAGENRVLDAFDAFDRGKGPDLYKVAASDIYNRKPDQISKPERQVGKVALLALGYQGGPGAFAKMAKGYGLDIATAAIPVRAAATPENIEKANKGWKDRGAKTGMGEARWMTAELIKLAWRDRNSRIVAMWHALEDAAIEAVQNPGKQVGTGKIDYKRVGSFLFCRLPSGRVLTYPYPTLKRFPAPWTDDNGKPVMRDGLVYKGVNSVTRQWSEQHFYGGLACENVVQAVARDCMVNGMMNVTKAGYPIVLTVHDEAVAERPLGEGSQEEFEALMVAPAPWMRGLPLAAEGYVSERYRK